MTVTQMLDMIHANVPNIPANVPKVAGYLTGSPDIKWTADDRARFKGAGFVSVDQSPGLELYAAGLANVADIETGAGTVAAFVAATAQRYQRGEQGWIYGGESVIADTATEMRSAGLNTANTGCWLADWNLNEAGAAARLGTNIGGIRIVAVQWASPTSNPTSVVVPGTRETLAQLQCDVSITEESWFSAPVVKTPPPVATYRGVVVTSDLTSIPVTSKDRKSWEG
jgi:hypothetical protein